MFKNAMVRGCVVTLALATWGVVALVAQGARGAAPAANPSFGPLTVKPLEGNVYWTQGGTGGNNCNTGFIIGDRGVIVIDAKLNPESATLMLDAIRTITPKPVTHVILTHSDGDHVNGLAAFPSGVTVVAHEGAVNELKQAIASGGPGAPPAAATPTQVVRGGGESLTINGVRLQLVHVAPAHTSGDLAVFLRDTRILFTGDLMATTRPEPLVHPEKGGTSNGFVESYRALIGLGAGTIVTGHGTLVTNADLQTRMTETQTKREKVRALVAEGKSLEAIKKELGDPETVAGPNGRGIAPLTEIIYRETAQ